MDYPFSIMLLEKIKEVFDGDASQKMVYCGVLRFTGLKYIEICKLTNAIMPTVKTRLHRHWKLYKNDVNYRRDVDYIIKTHEKELTHNP